MPGRTELEFQFGGKKAGSRDRAGDDAGLRMLVIGDFAGGSATAGELTRRPLMRVTIDNFDETMRKVQPALTLPAAAPDQPAPLLAFTALDDFHPDQLCQRLEIFAGFRALRARLLDPGTFAETAAALEPQAEATKPPAAPDDDGTLERLLGARRAPASPGGIDAFLREVVSPHVTAAPDVARQKRLVAAIDEASAHHLRALLHAPAFQRLEASWRALQRLVSTISDEIAVFLLPASRAELAADLSSGGSELQRRLSEASAPFSVIVLAETFSPDAADLDLLGAAGAVAAEAGLSIVAGADPRVDWTALDSDAAARWQRLRKSAQAGAIGLALPRWLLRLPYGAKTDPIESFPFDEMGGTREHEAYLWGNPAFACALLLAAGFQEFGDRAQPGDVLELDDLPAHTFRQDGAVELQPCAERYISEPQSTALLGRGLMPLDSARDRPSVRLARFQSIADPPSALRGPWDDNG